MTTDHRRQTSSLGHPKAKNRAIVDFHCRVRQILEQRNMTHGSHLIVAVSGGTDSMALLHSLHHLRDSLKLRLHGAHLNHSLRGDESKADAEYVAESFRQFDMPFSLEETNVSSFRQLQKLSLEEAAREVRYAFLTRVAAEQHADAITLGHTADDQVETILMHIIRGSGLVGLQGMEPLSRRHFGGITANFLRPLLNIPRQMTSDYCRALGLNPRLDTSNLSRDPMRNRLRLELLPLLEGYNPAIRKALLRLSRTASQQTAYVEGELDKIWHLVVSKDQYGARVNRIEFSQLSTSIQNHLLRRVFKCVKGDLKNVDQKHIDDMARILSGPAGKSLDLPGGIQFTIDYAEASLAPSGNSRLSPPPLTSEYRLQIPGDTLIPGWHITATLVRPEQHVSNHGSHREISKNLTACLGHKSVGERLWIRSRHEGDRFHPLGMPQDKKLQDFMVDSKIPRAERDHVPLVVAPKGVAWVVGWRMAEWARVKEREDQCLHLTVQSRPDLHHPV